MITIARSKLNEMESIVIDEETGMTQLDYWEWSHCYDDIDIIEDVDEDEYYDDYDECGFNPYMGCYDYDC